jgi:hypothetical protein
MGYFACYVVSEDGPPVDGDQVATARGLLAWGDWVLARTEAYPLAAELAEEGALAGVEELAELEKELRRMGSEQAPEHVGGVTTRLLDAVRQRPPGTLGILVSDGEPG